MANEIAQLKSTIAQDINTNDELVQFMADLDKNAMEEVLKNDPYGENFI
jgi:hypothetical protein